MIDDQYFEKTTYDKHPKTSSWSAETTYPLDPLDPMGRLIVFRTEKLDRKLTTVCTIKNRGLAPRLIYHKVVASHFWQVASRDTIEDAHKGAWIDFDTMIRSVRHFAFHEAG